MASSSVREADAGTDSFGPGSLPCGLLYIHLEDSRDFIQVYLGKIDLAVGNLLHVLHESTKGKAERNQTFQHHCSETALPK